MKRGILIISLFLISVLVISGVNALDVIAPSDEDLRPFEKVLEDYGIAKWQVIGGYNLIDTGEIPIYEFEYVWDRDYSFVSTFLTRIKRILRVQKTTIKVPAIKLSDEEWKQYSPLFVVSIDYIASKYYSKGFIEYELITNYEERGIPAYKIKTNMMQSTPDGLINIVKNVPAIEMGKGTNKEGTKHEQLWTLWGEGKLNLVRAE